MKPFYLLLFLPVIAGAQTTIHVPDAQANQGPCNSVPFYQDPEWRYQVLLTPAQLGNRQFRITDIALAPCTTGTFTASKFEVRMAHYPTSSLSLYFDSNLAMDRTTVFQGPVSWQYIKNQWCSLGLTNTFDYNARNNLVVEVRYAGGQGGSTFHRSSTIQRIYKFGPGAYTNTKGGMVDSSGLKMRFTVKEIYLAGGGSGAPGSSYAFTFQSKADPGRLYQVGSSTGKGPTILGTRRIGLSLDSLLAASTSNSIPGIFSRYAGYLDNSGMGRANLNIPNDPNLKGIWIYTAFVLPDPMAPYGILDHSNPVGFMIR